MRIMSHDCTIHIYFLPQSFLNISKLKILDFGILLFCLGILHIDRPKLFRVFGVFIITNLQSLIDVDIVWIYFCIQQNIVQQASMN